ncbi:MULTISPECIES: hypothetical protein [unclassified Streptomyces]|uniref:hypothetical protein n=1 Tax=unclassified Streptomyces TaxID=2593676 RepID=UPI0036E25795
MGIEVRLVRGQNVSQVPGVDDQRAVEEFPTASADPALDVCVRPRGLDWGEQYPDAFGCEDGIEGMGELLRVSVPQQELHLVEAVVQRHEEVTGLLDRPAAGRGQ